MNSHIKIVFVTILVCACASFPAANATERSKVSVKGIVDAAILPLMKRHSIPGMAIGVLVAGRSYVFDYGVASRETHNPVTRETLFELGSVSKTFTATLASYAQVCGLLEFSDKTSKYLPSLTGTAFGDVSLLHLATHTPGGMPLQVPDNVKNMDQLMQYLANWQPSYAPGTYRTYANPSIGLLGVITATAMHDDFAALLQARLWGPLGMAHTYIDLPEEHLAQYAQGYTSNDVATRLSAGVLSSEAYGVKSTAADVLRFVDASMDLAGVDATLRRAIRNTQTGYFRAGAMTQDLIWEQYFYPVDLPTLLAGNSPAISYAAVPVSAIVPPQGARADVLVNKTGSTNGFASYVAFIPEKRTGIVMLANKNYSIDTRVAVAFRILSQLTKRVGAHD